MDRLLARHNGLSLYDAGFPNFPKNFSRDSLVSAILMQDSQMLHDQLIFCAMRQGQKADPISGEEIGKIFHEHPPEPRRGCTTEFNACDTTALFLIGCELYQELTGDDTFTVRLTSEIKLAVSYIRAHLDQDLFYETPSFCGNDKFGLRVTYWKDSYLLDRIDGEPCYPIIYSLAHIQNLSGMRSAGRLLKSPKIFDEAARMHVGLEAIFDEQTGGFIIAKDRNGVVRGNTSDTLHALFYLEVDDLSSQQLEKIVERSMALETPAGYRTMAPEEAVRMKSSYHSNTIWPFEQACIHLGARKFNLKRLQQVSMRVISYLDTDPEILSLNGELIEKDGCDPQLWTIAAKKYFGTFDRDKFKKEEKHDCWNQLSKG